MFRFFLHSHSNKTIPSLFSSNNTSLSLALFLAFLTWISSVQRRGLNRMILYVVSCIPELPVLVITVRQGIYHSSMLPNVFSPKPASSGVYVRCPWRPIAKLNVVMQLPDLCASDLQNPMICISAIGLLSRECCISLPWGYYYGIGVSCYRRGMSLP